MSVVVTNPPAALVDLATAKAHLRVDHDDEDTLITLLIGAASAKIDGPEGILGHSFGSQTLVYRADEFGDEPLPFGPTISVTSVAYLDSAGVSQPLAQTVDWVLRSDGTVTPVSAWPAVYDDPEAVTITYVAGRATVPDPVKWAVLLMVGFLYENREASADQALTSGPVRALLGPYSDWPI